MATNRSWRDNVGSPGLVFDAGGSVTTSVNKKDRGIACMSALIPGDINAVLFLEASHNDADWHFYRDTDGARVYIDPSAVTTTEWWTVKADIYPAFHVRWKACTNTNGTAGSALASGGTIVMMGLT